VWIRRNRREVQRVEAVDALIEVLRGSSQQPEMAVSRIQPIGGAALCTPPLIACGMLGSRAAVVSGGASRFVGCHRRRTAIVVFERRSAQRSGCHAQHGQAHTACVNTRYRSSDGETICPPAHFDSGVNRPAVRVLQVRSPHSCCRISPLAQSTLPNAAISLTGCAIWRMLLKRRRRRLRCRFGHFRRPR